MATVLTDRLKFEIGENPLVQDDTFSRPPIEPWELKSNVVELRLRRKDGTYSRHRKWRRNERAAIANRRSRDRVVYKLIEVGKDIVLVWHPNGYNPVRDGGRREGNRVLEQIHYPDGREIPVEPKHTNEILEFLGYRGENEKKTYLRSFNGNVYYGADVIRAAYHLARFFGLRMNGDVADEIRRETVQEIAYAVDKYGMQNTDLFLSAVGINNVKIFRDFLPLDIGGKTSLVPAKKLDHIIVELGESPLKSIIGPTSMGKLGYSATKINGFQVYW